VANPNGTLANVFVNMHPFFATTGAHVTYAIIRSRRGTVHDPTG